MLASENTGAGPVPGTPLTVEVEAEDSLCAWVLRMDDEAGVVAMGVSFALSFPLSFDEYLVCSVVLPPTWVAVRRKVALGGGAVPTNAACIFPSPNAETGCLLDAGVGLGSYASSPPRLSRLSRDAGMSGVRVLSIGSSLRSFGRSL